MSSEDPEGKIGDKELFYDIHIFCCTNDRPETHRPAAVVWLKERGSYVIICAGVPWCLGLGGIRVNHAGCLNRCELGPTMVIYPEGVWYTYACEDDIDEILKSHVMHGRYVKRLLLRPDQGPRH